MREVISWRYTTRAAYRLLSNCRETAQDVSIYMLSRYQCFVYPCLAAQIRSSFILPTAKRNNSWLQIDRCARIKNPIVLCKYETFLI